MYIQVFGRHEPVLPTGWGAEVSVSVMGDTRINATAEQGPDAKLTVVAVLCDATVLVPPESNVQLSGGDILGSHRVEVDPGADGSLIRVQAVSVLGSIKIRAADSPG